MASIFLMWSILVPLLLLSDSFGSSQAFSVGPVGVNGLDWAKRALVTTRRSSQAKNIATPSSDVVEDRDEHVRILHGSLIDQGGPGLCQLMQLDDNDKHWPAAVHQHLRYAVLSHGAVNGLDGPVNTYANFASAAVFSYPRAQLLDMPACRMAVPGYDQEELTNLYLRVRETGLQMGHAGFYGTSDQRRFHVRDAVVRRMWGGCRDEVLDRGSQPPLYRFGTVARTMASTTAKPFSLIEKR